MQINNLSQKIKIALLVIGIIFTAMLSNANTDNTTSHKVKLSIDNKIEPTKPDFSNIKDVKQKKQMFIQYIQKSIDNANKVIQDQKYDITAIRIAYDKNHKLDIQQDKILNKYIEYYNIQRNIDINNQLDELNIRIGTVPRSITLAQAILESGWGTSRFAKDNNNYYGIHCFTKNCGIKASGADVYLEEFNSINQSTLGYYKMVNTGGSFTEFRNMRINKNKTDIDILNTLNTYSELESNEYPERLLQIINQNDLSKYNDY